MAATDRAAVMTELMDKHAKFGSYPEFDAALEHAARQLGITTSEMRERFNDALALVPGPSRPSASMAMSVSRSLAGGRGDDRGGNRGGDDRDPRDGPGISYSYSQQPSTSYRTGNNRHSALAVSDSAGSRGVGGRHRPTQHTPDPRAKARCDEFIRKIRPWSPTNEVYSRHGRMMNVNHIKSYIDKVNAMDKRSFLKDCWDNAEAADIVLLDKMCDILNLAGVGKAKGSVWQAYTVMLSGMSPKVPDQLERYKSWFGATETLEAVWDHLKTAGELLESDPCDDMLVYACIGALAADICSGRHPATAQP